MYKRVLIKLSGEALGENGVLFDFVQIKRVAKALKALHDAGAQVAVVIGAGNIWRGRRGPAAGMNAVNADNMGMLGTAVNCIAMQDALEQLGLDARTMSAVPMHRFAETYVTADAVRHLQAGRVVLFACGIGCPAFSTDTTAALRAIEIGADAILLAKNIDGVYDDDPHINPAAKRLDDLTYEEAQRRNLKVMDEAAFILCKENNVQAVRVFGLDDPENIVRVAQGERLGSVVHP
ncbi:MAG TPA: UMP kinase [Candidatus Aphodomonas merdavium]|nr:UMP kinase [Candidatus Aphodomonas merdavium]